MAFRPGQMQESVLGKYLMQIAEARNQSNLQNQQYAFRKGETDQAQAFQTGEREAGQLFTGGQNELGRAHERTLQDERIKWEGANRNIQQQQVAMEREKTQAQTDMGVFFSQVPEAWRSCGSPSGGPRPIPG